MSEYSRPVRENVSRVSLEEVEEEFLQGSLRYRLWKRSNVTV
jgi:hypothetical protein